MSPYANVKKIIGDELAVDAVAKNRHHSMRKRSYDFDQMRRLNTLVRPLKYERTGTSLGVVAVDPRR